MGAGIIVTRWDVLIIVSKMAKQPPNWQLAYIYKQMYWGSIEE